MSGHTRPGLLAICLLAVTLAASAASAQAPSAPAGQDPTPGPPSAGAADDATICKTPRKDSAGGASVVPAAQESLQHKNWQARGGEIQFTVRSPTKIPDQASVLVCFRWKVQPASSKASPENTKKQEDIETIPMRPSRLELSDAGKQLKVTTSVPRHLGSQPSNVDSALWLVPLAEVRIVAAEGKEPKADATTAIGITYPLAGVTLAIATVAMGLFVLYLAAKRRLAHLGIRQASWPLRIISTPSGSASLSQFQILLWTFVVAASAVYVMSLSGQLIEITSGMLGLLGIAGAAGVLAKAHSEVQGASADAAGAQAAAKKTAAQITADQKAAEAAAAPANSAEAARLIGESNLEKAEAGIQARIEIAAKTKADALKNPPPTQVPRWSDLIVSEGTTTREIDVARFQMLLFTLITAVFVVMNVTTTYVIPEISTGFLTLMGISNGVYLGSKIAQRS